MTRTDRLAEAHDRLVAAIEHLTTGEDWQRFLDTARRFRTYSLNNLLLIFLQRPDATRVAGYRTWQSLGRQVRRGEQGIAILAPSPTDEQTPTPTTQATNPPASSVGSRSFTSSTSPRPTATRSPSPRSISSTATTPTA
jgi:hypothetical protein